MLCWDFTCVHTPFSSGDDTQIGLGTGGGACSGRGLRTLHPWGAGFPFPPEPRAPLSHPPRWLVFLQKWVRIPGRTCALLSTVTSENAANTSTVDAPGLGEEEGRRKGAPGRMWKAPLRGQGCSSGCASVRSGSPEALKADPHEALQGHSEAQVCYWWEPVGCLFEAARQTSDPTAGVDFRAVLRKSLWFLKVPGMEPPYQLQAMVLECCPSSPPRPALVHTPLSKPHGDVLAAEMDPAESGSFGLTPVC